MLTPETRDVCSGSHRYCRSPAKFFQNRIGFLLDGIRNNFTKHRRKFKSMSAITGGDHESFTFRIGRDAKISIVGIAIHAHARISNWSLGEGGERPGQKFAEVLFFLGSNGPLWGFGGHFTSRPVVCNLHDAITIERKPVITRRRDIRAKPRETLRCTDIRWGGWPVEA